MMESTQTKTDLITTGPTTVEKLRGLKWSIAANAANTVNVQYTFFGSVFVLFLSALGLSKTQMGFLLSLLPFFGLIALFVAPTVARLGYKRTYLSFFALRSAIAGSLLLTPAVIARYGSEATLTFIAIIMSVFAMARAIGVTANLPWVQEYVPSSMRSRYTATNNIFTTTTGFIAVSIAGAVLARMSGLSGFMLLISVGVVFGFISVGLASRVPGGAPVRPDETGKKQRRELGTALRDSNFLSYLAGVGLLTLVTVPLASFIPLFMREEVGLSQQSVVLLQSGTLLGTLLSSYVWAWIADRYGSVLVTLYGLSLRAMLPIFWMLMPRESPNSLYFALAIAFLQGVADMGWGIGSGRLLYVRVVPPDKRSDYMALYYAWIGIVGGISQLSGGRILDLTQGISGEFWKFSIDPFFPLFIAGIIFPLLSFLLIRRVRDDDGAVGVGEFAGIFLRGNPFLAMTSMMRFHLARDERATILMTERLAQSKSPLTVEELLEALHDPRFNVRFEAVIAISRMPPDPRLTEALVELLEGTELALTAVAAWALGRMGDPEAIPHLRNSLDSDYRSIRAHSARALGSVGDTESAVLLLERIRVEKNKGLQMAYASALGHFHTIEATPYLLKRLYDMENKGARMELALSLARLVGDEHIFIQLVRNVRADAGTTLSQTVSSFRRHFNKMQTDKKLAQELDSELNEELNRCAETFARNNLDSGVKQLGAIIEKVQSGLALLEAGELGTGELETGQKEMTEEATAQILSECAERLNEFGAERHEYVILALHTLQSDARL